MKVLADKLDSFQTEDGCEKEQLRAAERLKDELDELILRLKLKMIRTEDSEEDSNTKKDYLSYEERYRLSPENLDLGEEDEQFDGYGIEEQFDEYEIIDIEGDLQSLLKSLRTFSEEVEEALTEAVKIDLKPTEHSNKVFKEMKDKERNLEETIAEISTKIKKYDAYGKTSKRQFSEYDDANNLFSHIHNILKKLKTYADGDYMDEETIKLFKMTAKGLVNVDLHQFRPGATFSEWMQQIKDIQQRFNTVDEELIIQVIFKSMKKYNKEDMVLIKSRNLLSVADIERVVYGNYGSPLILNHQLMEYHQSIGQLPLYVDNKNAGIVYAKAESHLFAIQAGIVQLEYQKTKYGSQQGETRMLQGYLSNKSIYEVASMLPQELLVNILRKMSSMEETEKLNYVKTEFSILKEDALEITAAFGCQIPTLKVNPGKNKEIQNHEADNCSDSDEDSDSPEHG